jgi:uncharacterized repeat protein (TIGR01451 family)
VWSIAGQGAGWSNTCAIAAGVLSCGPVTVPAGTTQAASTFTVHITSPTTSATAGVCPAGSGVINNTGNVATTNDGSDQSSASTCVASAVIHIVKTADAAQVNAGEPIGFTLTVYNDGTGDAKGVTLSDTLPVKAGLSWSIAGQGAGWSNTCAIAAGVLSCGPVTVPAGTTQAASTFTVHITSPTTAATGGVCPGGSGVIDNTGNVTTTNDSSDQSTASTCVAAPAIHIVKTADAAQVNAGEPIGFTLTVYNDGSGDAKGVTLTDTLPVKAGLAWSIAGQGAGWNNSCAIAAGILSCGPVTVPAGTTQAASTFTVHITSPTTAATGGVCPAGSGVIDNTGNVTTTNDSSDQSSASTCVAAPAIHIVKTADAAQVNAGEPIGFTLTVYNNGTGDAKGVTLTDTLPVKAGLSWSIAGQGAGWNNTCAIAAGILSCGPVTVPAGTTQAASTFTVHITSPTTAATGGVCPGGSGVIDNTGNVTTTNDSSDQSTASTCVAAPAIHIVKTADAAQVNAGEPIGFTLTVWNDGTGDAKGVTLSDTLPVKAGLAWSIAGQGAGWNNTCAIAAGILSCGPVTVPAGTTQAASTFTVHITSPTTAATGGVCPRGSGVVDNTGNVTTTNDGSDQSSASTCVAAPVIHIVKTADAAQVNAGDPIGFTLTVWNDGSGDAKGVTLSDTLPVKAGLSWTIDAQGAGWNNTCAIAAGVLTCGPVTVPAGTTQAASTFTVHITSPTTSGTAGTCPGGSGVINNTGNVTTTNDGSDQSTASTCVAAPGIHILKTADAAQVNAGDPIGFTLTVWNDGTGDAKGVTLSDTLPVKAGLVWSIDAQGLGWAGSCSINLGVLTCGPVTVPAGTTQVASTFTLHISSPTTAATGGVCPAGSGVIDNTGTVNTTNAGTDQSTASTCVAAPSIHIVKTADAAQVNAGEPIGFTLTVFNNGTGDAKGVTLSDTLPVKAGLAWSIAGQGAGWSNTCAIAAGVLTCGPVTVPAGTTQAASTFTVHITSPTTAATGGVCPGGSGVIDNTGNVATTNDGSDQSTASTCVAAPAIHIVKTADAAQVNAGDPIGFTLTVWNDGSGDAKGVALTDTLPVKAGLSWSIAGQGAGWSGSCAIAAGVLSCGPVTVPAGTTQAASTFTVHITSPTTSATGGACPGNGEIDNTGNVTTTNDGSGQSSASTCVAAPAIHIVKTADAAQVNAGDPIGFTLTVWNDGSGDAKGVALSDTLPVKAGLSWSIAGQGAGWNNTCAIAAGVLSCGPVTVPAGTTQVASTFTVHITSPTTAATGGVCPRGSGVVDNTGNVATTNDGSDQSTASTCVAAPAIHIVKTADAAQVNAGDPIGFTLTVWNDGSGDAKGVALADTLPVKAGLSWSIDAQGAGWNNTCAIAAGVLSCGPVTVPAGTTQAASTFTVHITSPTTSATGGACPGSGEVDNTGNVTTTNDGSGQSSASTCVAAPAIHIVKTADAAQVNAGDPIGFTLTVWNDGSGDAKGVALTDTLPTNAGLSWSIAGQGAGWSGSCAIAAGVLSCGPATVPAGTTQAASTFTVHITSPTTAATGGTCPGTGEVDNTGNVTTTNDGSGQSSASTCVAAPAIHIVKTADAAQVSAGDPIGFTLTVYNDGTGDAKGVTLADTLPTNAGLSWSIDAQGAGWNNTCAIAAGVLSCGPVTVPAGTTQAASTFTVHITSPTTAATGGTCPGGSGTVDNTGNVTTTNDGSGQSSASTCVAAPSIHIVKTADAAQVNVGSPIGFTLTVFNNGAGDAKGVTLADTLPTNAGLSWSISGQGAGWAGSCSIAAGVLSCGPVTVPAGTTLAASSFTVHITSPTTAAAGGDCPGNGTVDNTGNVTTSNDGSDQSSASTCVQALVDLSVTKAGSPATQTLGDGNITWTIVVTNSGPDADTNVKIVDPMPAGNTFVSATTSQGSCTGGVLLNCSLGTMAAGASVTITLVTTPSTVGDQTNTVTVAGDRPETNTANNQASATVRTVGVITPPAPCIAVSKVAPKQLFVGRKTKLTIHVTQAGKAIKGIHVRIKGPKLDIRTAASNSKGVITRTVKMKKAGILIFSPIASKRCNTKRLGVTNVFTPPVTG